MGTVAIISEQAVWPGRGWPPIRGVMMSNIGEAMKYLVDGKKVGAHGWHKDTYIVLTDKKSLVNQQGRISLLNNHIDYFVYHEPPPKKTVYQWRYQMSSCAQWRVGPKLRTQEAADRYYDHKSYRAYEIHSGPYEVDQ